MKSRDRRGSGIISALVSATFLGFAPIFGKQAILLGFTPLATVALRTSAAALLLLILVLIFKRQFFYIYPAGLMGCALAGFINGVGSILYYISLGRLNAGIGQLLYSLYPIFLAGWLILDKQSLSRITYIRIAMSLIGIILLTSSQPGGMDWIGVFLMLGAALMYALHIPINQRVLFDVPAPTVTLYTLISMSIVVIPAYLLFDRHIPPTNIIWTPIIGLTLVTLFSRLTLFLGVKHIGSMQTALLSLWELLVAIVFSVLWLHEYLMIIQWSGALFLAISLILVSFEKKTPGKKGSRGRFLGWLHPPEISTKYPWQPHD
jgi:drug/metabolite transporter (DMT)-like permease